MQSCRTTVIVIITISVISASCFCSACKRKRPRILPFQGLTATVYAAWTLGWQDVSETNSRREFLVRRYCGKLLAVEQQDNASFGGCKRS